MQTELAQIISLTSYGNEFIKTGQVPDNYFPGSTVFQHCNKVDFSDFKAPFLSSIFTEKRSAINPIDWFELLKKGNCVRLRLYYQASEDKSYGPEYNHAGFVGGAGSWLIETNFGSYSHYWQKKWLVIDKEAKDRKIWAVNCSRMVKKFKPADLQSDVQKTRIQFSDTIKELSDFCVQQKLNHWIETFEKAGKILSDTEPSKQYYHFDLIVLKNYSLASQQLLFSAATAWIFGGMGSWNDMRFDEQKIQEKCLQLSQRLYVQLVQAILATTNSF